MTTTPDTPHAAEPEDSGVAAARTSDREATAEQVAGAAETDAAETAPGTETDAGETEAKPVDGTLPDEAATDEATPGDTPTDEATPGDTPSDEATTAQATTAEGDAEDGPETGGDEESDEASDDAVRDLALFALTVAHEGAPKGPVTVTPSTEPAEADAEADSDAEQTTDATAATEAESAPAVTETAAPAPSEVATEDEPALFAPPTQHAAVPRPPAEQAQVPPPADPTEVLPPAAGPTEVLPAIRQPGSPADATEVLPPFPFPATAQRQSGQAPRHPAPRRPSSAIPLGPVPVQGGAQGGVGQQAHDYAPEAAYAGWEPAAPPDPAARRRRLALAGSVAGAVVLLALGAVAVVNAVDPGDWSYLEGDVASAQEADAVQLVLGTCVEQLPPDGDVGEVTVVPCAEEHSAQVVGRTDFAPEAIWPGEDAARQRVSQVCGPEQLGEAARAAESSASLTYVVWTPSEASWADGDRVGLCLASSDSPTVGSLLE